MEITLENIELVKDRTGVSYKEAKEALEFAGGNVVDAIIYIEENIDKEYTAGEKKAVNQAVDRIKAAVRKGNVTKLKIYHGDDVVLNLPITFGLVGTVLFPWGAVASVLAAAVTKCRVELVKEDGSVIDISEKAGDAFEIVKDKGGVVMDEVRDKGSDLYAVAKEKGAALYETAKEKGADIYAVAKDKGADIYAVAKDKAGDLTDRLGKKAKGMASGAGDATFANVEEAAEEIVEDIIEE